LAASQGGSIIYVYIDIYIYIHTHLVGLLWMSDRPVAKASTCTDNTTQKDEFKHPFLERDSNPPSQGPSDQGFRLRPRGHWERLLPDYGNETNFGNAVVLTSRLEVMNLGSMDPQGVREASSGVREI
jgi:hypothetical protein